MPLLPDSSVSTNSSSAPVRPPPVDPLPGERRRPPFFASVDPPLPLISSPLPLSDVSSPSLASAVPSPISFSLPPSPLFLLSALPVIASLPLGALLLSLVFFLRAPAHTVHHQSLTSLQS